jgi:YYY domain-containing protein
MVSFTYLVIWLVACEAIWLAALPLAGRLYHPLVDGGAAFARPLGMVVIGYAVWLLSSFGVLAVTGPTALAALLALAGFAWIGDAGRRQETLARLRGRNRLLWASELVWLLGFLGMAAYRAYNPEIVNTEKPMDFLFLNTIARGERLPPEDPWLAGYPVSYYYFGYYLFALLGKLGAVPTNFGFNLALATLFWMLLSGAFSLGANLVALGSASRREGVRGKGEREVGSPPPDALPLTGASERVGTASPRVSPSPGRGGGWGERSLSFSPSLVGGAFAALFVGLASNLEGVLEALKRLELLTPGLLQLFAVHDLRLEPEPVTAWWWWRASRVISDIDPVSGGRGETINEFPFFSYLLGDLHPHVMAAPFFLAVAALGLVLLAQREPIDLGWARRRPLEAALGALLVGALGFLNAWDFPTGVLLLSAARLVWGVRHGEPSPWPRAIGFGVALLLAGLVLYLPFYAGLRSQAIGLGIVAIRTRPAQFLLFWGLFLFVVGSTAVVALLRRRAGIGPGTETNRQGRQGRQDAEDARDTPDARRQTPDARRRRQQPFPAEIAVPVVTGVVAFLVATAVGAAVLGGLVLLLALLLAVVLAPPAGPPEARAGRPPDSVRTHGNPPQSSVLAETAPEGTPGWDWALTMAGVGLLLLAICEVAFVSDVFGSRLNTVFKLYYQAWPLLACASAYGLYYVVSALGGRPTTDDRRPTADDPSFVLRPSSFVRPMWLALFAALLVGSLCYTVMAPYAKTERFAKAPTLDGMRWLGTAHPSDAAALTWLRGAVPGMPVTLEAKGRAYDYPGRVAAYTGLPTLVGWVNHELQWRGNLPVYGQRESEVDAIYRQTDAAALTSLLNRYGIRYVYYGEVERQAYGDLDDGRRQRFADALGVAYNQGGVTIFGPAPRPSSALATR